jgi:hypothetical protein
MTEAEGMSVEEKIINHVEEAFGSAPRPEHFTNYEHCCECFDHDELLRARDRQTLTIEDVGNAGWDPVCFMSVEGFRYYLPALLRLALDSDTYLPQLLFHLLYDGERNARMSHCSPAERKAVVDFLWHTVEHRPSAVADCEEDLQRAIAIWSDGAEFCER